MNATGTTATADGDDVMAWLLEGDPAVRWQVHRDLLDSPADIVEAERAKVATDGWGARLLAHQDPDGRWAQALYSPKWTSTTYTLMLLRHLGLPATNEAARRGVAVLLDGMKKIDGGLTFGKTHKEAETCITAMVVSLAEHFNMADDERVDDAWAWLLTQQLDDGGFNCETVRSGSRHGSFDTTISTVEALQARRDARGLDVGHRLVLERSWEFFAAHRLYCSHRTGAVVHPSYTRIVFPPGWHHDLLRGLDHLAVADAPRDPRLVDAVDLLGSRRRPDGTWVTNANHPGRYWFRLEAAGKPSRTATLRALRVLRWWNAATP